MNSFRKSSKQTLAVLRALVDGHPAWTYGYELSKQAQLKSGTLYPILMRLSDRELLASQWEESPAAGRPPRHMYRLTASGLQYAKDQLESAQETIHIGTPASAGNQV